MIKFLGKGALVAGALAAVALPGSASAQSYGQPSGYGYDQRGYDACTRQEREQQTAGGLIGATIGAIAGSQIASRGVRTEGSVLGGVVGAAIGSSIGRDNAACGTTDRGYGAYGRRYDDAYSRPYGYDYGGYDRRYERRDYDRRYERERNYDYGRADDRVRDYQDADQCRLAESRISLPDGREEVRYVRTCPDAQGRYRVVD